MKKFLLSFLSIFSFFLFSQVNAQAPPLSCDGGTNNCSIAATNFESAVTKTEIVNGQCVKTTTVSFTLLHNNGMKFVNFYFFNDNFPTGFTCGSEPGGTKKGEDYSLANLGAYVALMYVNNAWEINPAGLNIPATAGYTLTSTINVAGTQTDFVLTGVKFVSPLPCSTGEIVMYVAGSNAAQNSIQCYNSTRFTPYLTVPSGKVNCKNGASPLSYDLFIDANFRETKEGPLVPVSGTYKVFIDVNSNNVIDGGDIELDPLTTKNFVTTAVGAPEGITRFSIFGVPITGLANGDANSTKRLLVEATPTTEGIATVVGPLTNLCATLPVSFKSFNASIRSGKAALTWETAQELNNSGFEVQRRGASGQYEKIGFVDSKAPNGNGAAFSYSFDDNFTLPKGVTYYRLRQVDLDGRSTYSEIKAVRAGNSQLVISIYPNPSRGTANVAIPESAGKMDVSLDDYTGKSIQRWNGISVRNLQINNMKPGIYMLRINLRESGEIITERIVVQ